MFDTGYNRVPDVSCMDHTRYLYRIPDTLPDTGYFTGYRIPGVSLSDASMSLCAQFASILYPVGRLVFDVQTDRKGAISYTFLLMFRCFAAYYNKQHWWVADVEKTSNPNESTQWDGNAKFPQRDYMGDPVASGDGPIVRGNDRVIQMVRHPIMNLHEHSVHLVRRIRRELGHYVGKPTRDRLLAMACNPFSATLLMVELASQQVNLRLTAGTDDVKSFVEADFRSMAMDALEEEIRKFCSEIIPDHAVDEEAAADDAGDMISRIRRQMLQKGNPNVSTVEADADPVKATVRKFFNQTFSIHSELFTQTNSVDADFLKSIGTKDEQRLKSWQRIAEVFDVMDWWERVGKVSFPLIYPVACAILALPDSNGHQERTFSAATWMDGKLRKKQSDLTFQMKVLLYKNKEFLEMNRKYAEEEAKKAAEARTKELLRISASLRKEEDIDDEFDDMLSAVEQDSDEEALS